MPAALPSGSSKCAFVASGGGIKGYAFHLGVLRALEEAGFHPLKAGRSRASIATSGCGRILDMFIGSSAGACIGAASIFLESLDEAEAVIGLRPTELPRLGYFTLFRPHLFTASGWRLSGLCYAHGIERYFRRHMHPNDFRALEAEFYVCATQLNGSRNVIFGRQDSSSNGRYDPYIAYYNDVPISEAIAASVSVPGLYAPYRITNRRGGDTFEYTDGEVRETLSVHVARDNGVDLVIVSNAWMPYHYDARLGSVSRRGLGAVLSQTITQIVEQKIDRMRNEYDRYRLAIAQIREQGRTAGWPSDAIETLVGRVSETLRYRPMDEIYVAPAREDSEFNLLPSWSLKRKYLRVAIDVGFARAQKAIAEWQARR